jgi:hypothetical protein
MKKNIQNTLLALTLFLVPGFIFGQTPPTLGGSSTFVLFTSNGAVTNTGVSQITGDVGTDLGGPSTGFGNVNGQMHDGDGVSATAAFDLNLAYINLGAQTPTTPHAILLGSETLTPAIYAIPAVASLSGVLTLDGLGDPNACFVFQLGAAFSSAPGSSIVLINGAKACNVFWRIDGATNLTTGTSFVGTIICNGAIVLASGNILEGRALSIAGAVTVTGVKASTPVGCGSPILTGPLSPNTCLLCITYRKRSNFKHWRIEYYWRCWNKRRRSNDGFQWRECFGNNSSYIRCFNRSRFF